MTSQLEREITSQPAVVARVLDAHGDAVPRLLSRLPAFDYVVIAGRGSSRHAGIYAQYTLGALTGIPVVFAPASLHTLYRATPRWQRGLVVAISQGGGSPDTRQVVEGARRLGRPTIAVTNDGTSPLAAAADHVIDLHAGEECSLAATKTYTAELAVMALITAALAGRTHLHRDLERLPDHLTAQLATTDAAHRLAADSVHVDAWTLLARGYNHPTALEGALKLIELTYAHATGHSSADYLHGPIAGADARTRVIVIAADDAPARPSLRQATRQLAARNVHITAVSASRLPDCRTLLPLTPGVPSWLSPLCAVIPLQQLAMAAAQAKGHDLDHPRGLTKITPTT